MPPTAFHHPDMGTLQVVLPKNVPKRLKDNYFEMRLQNFGKKKMKRTTRKGRAVMKHKVEHVCDATSQSSLSDGFSNCLERQELIQEQYMEQNQQECSETHMVNNHMLDQNCHHIVNNINVNTHWSTMPWDASAAQQETASILFALELEIAKSYEIKPAVHPTLDQSSQVG